MDTHVLMWALSEPERLPVHSRDIVSDRRHEVFFSAASIWECAIKYALRRPGFRHDPRFLAADALQTGFVELPVASRAAIRVASLPAHHRDPFDRLLIAQAIDQDALLLTADAALAVYGPPVLMLGAVPSRET
ncbi:type II toxin-antitoxin system VapC family toxin [Enterovirga aerilata]|uniref:type II toxin-antitoxin system VapC family toxin n=1 Tax=Enterovirga aerilata TaxID=2730920 RepID=UPI001FEF6D3B|nr:type II toxin-antitoxin system VapC family toxin [Enterovirga sp. DB1703]